MKISLKQLTIITGALALLSVLSVPAWSDQTLPLAYHTCSALAIGGQNAAQLEGLWENAPLSACRYPLDGTAKNWQATPFHCISDYCMNNCSGPCENCNKRICVATNITVDGLCQSPTSLLWITSFYTGGGGGGCGSHPC